MDYIPPESLRRYESNVGNPNNPHDFVEVVPDSGLAGRSEISSHFYHVSFIYRKPGSDTYGHGMIREGIPKNDFNPQKAVRLALDDLVDNLKRYR